jgi:hypothetical protein
MADQVLRPACDPCQVAYAQLASLAQRHRDREPGGVGQRSGSASGKRDRAGVEAAADLLGSGEVQAEQVAAIVRHSLILMAVAMIGVWSLRGWGLRQPHGCQFLGARRTFPSHRGSLTHPLAASAAI